MTEMQNLRLDLYHSGSAGHHDVAFLYRALQLHGATGQCGKSLRGFASQFEHSEVALALQLVAILVPPDICCPSIAQHHHLLFAGLFFFRQERPAERGPGARRQ